jgi:ABC-type sugar transport system permease subunit
LPALTEQRQTSAISFALRRDAMQLSLPRSKKRSGNIHVAEERAAIFFVAPAILHFLIFTSLPVFAVIYLSFTDYSILKPPQLIGLENYIDAFKDQVFWTAIGNTLVYVATVVPATVVLGLGAALLLNQALIGRSFYRVAIYMPHVTSAAAISMVWLWLFNGQFGLFNFVLEKLGLPAVNWLDDPDTALWAIIIMSVWRGVGSNMVLFLAGLQSIPQIMYEAAEVDGADRWNLFRRITLPLLTPTTFFVFVTSLIGSFQVFEQVYMMTRGGPGYATTTIVHQIYKQAFEHYKLGYASALSVVLVLVIFTLTMLNNKLLKSDVEYN